MKRLVCAFHRLVHAGSVARVADVELQARIVELLPHQLLLQFIAAEDSDLLKPVLQELFRHSVTEGTGATCDQYYSSIF